MRAILASATVYVILIIIIALGASIIARELDGGPRLACILGLLGSPLAWFGAAMTWDRLNLRRVLR